MAAALRRYASKSDPVGFVAVRRYWEHQIRDERGFERHMDYIHYNPVKHGYVNRPINWLFSTFHRYIQTGLLPEHWANNLALEDFTCGKR